MNAMFSMPQASFGRLIYKRVKPLFSKEEPESLPNTLPSYIDSEQIAAFDHNNLDLVVYEWNKHIDILAVSQEEKISEENMEIKYNALKEFYPYLTEYHRSLLHNVDNISSRLKEGVESLKGMINRFQLQNNPKSEDKAA